MKVKIESEVAQSYLTLSDPMDCSLPGSSICVPVLGIYGCGKACLFLIPFRLQQINCFTLSLKCFPFDSDNCPDVEIGPLLQFPHLLRAGPVLVTLLFFPLVPSSYRVFLWFYIFFPGEGNGTPLQYSCLENPMDGGAW